jgi:hypothetical protein
MVHINPGSVKAVIRSNSNLMALVKIAGLPVIQIEALIQGVMDGAVSLENKESVRCLETGGKHAGGYRHLYAQLQDIGRELSNASG